MKKVLIAVVMLGMTGGVYAVAPTKPVEWIPIEGGKFMMGTDRVEEGFKNAQPVHEVTIKTFDMAKAAVTVEEYNECVIEGKCTEPDTMKPNSGTAESCNWDRADRQLHPVNCVDWDQANQYAKFKDARLPTEAEWEYAARSGGKKQDYPWGDDKPDYYKVVMSGGWNGDPDGIGSTRPVCSKPAGNTAQGLCDMAGNVWQWVQDEYQDSYKGAPADGSAFEGASPYRVSRGGGFYIVQFKELRTTFRGRYLPESRFDDVGFRLARSR